MSRPVMTDAERIKRLSALVLRLAIALRATSLATCALLARAGDTAHASLLSEAVGDDIGREVEQALAELLDTHASDETGGAS